MLKFLLPLITFFFLFFANPALAHDCVQAVVEGQSFWQALAEHTLTILVTLLTPVLLVLVNKAIKVFESKTKIDVADRYEALIDECVRSGIAFAHEQSRKALKADQPPVPSDEKRIMAVELAVSKLETLGVIEQDAEVLAQLVDAKLNQERKDPRQKGRIE